MNNPSIDINISNDQDIIALNEDYFLNISNLMTKFILNKNEIIKQNILNDIDLKNICISFDIMFCNDATISEINSEYRNKTGPTDVITFALYADAPENRMVFNNIISLGEIIISIETAQKQAKENNKTLDQEIMFLISHGILHLLGIDHETDEKLEFMLNLQDKMSEFAVNNLG